jgi:cobalt/nickel transport protein
MLLPVASARAHFLELIPSTDIVSKPEQRAITVDAVFTHPFEGGPVMAMAEPVRVGVLVDGKQEDLRSRLAARPVDGKTGWRLSYTLAQPGDHVFFIQPAPYWEPAEKVMIVHYTKVVVDAFGGDDGWDAMVGLPVEIEPLSRPYGLWTGNLFSGVVRRGGEPVPFAEIEVEWRNDGSVRAPSDPFVTQVIKADAQGAFGYAMPRAGWWGFAALLEGDAPMKAPTGEEVPVEMGALIWVRAVDMK